jgi:hypothetical protein
MLQQVQTFLVPDFWAYESASETWIRPSLRGSLKAFTGSGASQAGHGLPQVGPRPRQAWVWWKARLGNETCDSKVTWGRERERAGKLRCRWDRWYLKRTQAQALQAWISCHFSLLKEPKDCGKMCRWGALQKQNESTIGLCLRHFLREWGQVSLRMPQFSQGVQAQDCYAWLVEERHWRLPLLSKVYLF